MLKLTNQLLQWLPTSQNPCMGSFGTSIGRKTKKLGLLEVSLFKLVVSGSTIHTPLSMNLAHTLI